MQGVPVSAIDRLPPVVRRVVPIVLRLLVAGVFVAAAIPKVLDPDGFARDIDNYHVLPAALVGPVAVLLPTIELTVAAALITGVHAAGAALVAIGMLATFAIAMAQAMARGIDLDCGCFGSASETQVSGLTIARNVALIAACVPIALASPRAPAPPSQTNAPEPAAGG